jgi:hypothetical protein
MVTDEVWAAAGLHFNDGMLCISCLEQRLERRLKPADFADVPINLGIVFDQSSRLRARLGNP